MKIYIAGPMQGLPDFNYPAFNRVTAVLREMGHEIRNPAEHPAPEDSDREAGVVTLAQHCEFMRKDLAWVMEVDAVALLPGWEESSGANIELTVARALGLMVFVVEEPDEGMVVLRPSAAIPTAKLLVTMSRRAAGVL